MAALGCGEGGNAERQSERPPNFVLILTDDMGYADLGAYGHPTIRTPVLDRLASRGQRWTNFYAPAAVCSPSRAGILTGRFAIRSGVAGENQTKHVFYPNSLGGLPTSEITIAELLQDRGYVSTAIGKWHLGHLPEFLPSSQGFESYFGIPYSNDMNMPGGIEEPWSLELFHREPNIEYWDVPLMEDDQILERPANQWTITKRYTERALRFINDNKDKPFFLYLAHNMPHTPVFASEGFYGASRRGLYGDVLEEIDWSVGEIVKTLEQLGIDDNTLIIFTSDNGPWLSMKQLGGSAGLLKEGKGTTWEGGMREPAIFYWPGKIEPEVVAGIGSGLDFLPTLAAIAGADLPGDRLYDGVDLSETLLRGGPSPREELFFWRFQDVFAVRKGPYKAHFTTMNSFSTQPPEQHQSPLLFNLEVDPSEQFNIADQHPEVVAELSRLVADHKKTIEPVVDQLNLYPPGQAPGEGGEASTERPWDQE
jgi:uncharacterized sulfatase